MHNLGVSSLRCIMRALSLPLVGSVVVVCEFTCPAARRILSSWGRDWNCVLCITRQILNNRTIKESLSFVLFFLLCKTHSRLTFFMMARSQTFWATALIPACLLPMPMTLGLMNITPYISVNFSLCEGIVISREIITYWRCGVKVYTQEECTINIWWLNKWAHATSL